MSPDRVHTPRCRDYIVHDTKERLQKRQVIELNGLRPLVLGDSSSRYWDGCTVRDQKGQRTSVSGDLQKQLRKMAAWGEFGNEVTTAILDHERYWHIHDRLLEWPEKEAIQREGLHEFETPAPRRTRSGDSR